MESKEAVIKKKKLSYFPAFDFSLLAQKSFNRKRRISSLNVAWSSKIRKTVRDVPEAK